VEFGWLRIVSPQGAAGIAAANVSPSRKPMSLQRWALSRSRRGDAFQHRLTAQRYPLTSLGLGLAVNAAMPAMAQVVVN